MHGNHHYRKQELITILNGIIDKTLGEVDVNHVFDRTITNPKITGIAGDVIEQSVLGYPADNSQKPDLVVDGVDTELKVTGLKIKKEKHKEYLVAKEPMSITAVSPKSIIHEQFTDSAFYHKVAHMLIVYYLYDSKTKVLAAEYARFPIKDYDFHDFSEDEMLGLQRDWQTVRDFIWKLQNDYDQPESQYSRISCELRPRLTYIDTAPKWPHSPRFRFKRAFVTVLVREHFGDRLSALPEHYASIDDIDVKLNAIVRMHYNERMDEACQSLGIPVTASPAKQLAQQVVVRWFGGKAKRFQDVEIFAKMGLTPKTITLSAKGGRTEDMKLFEVDFDEWSDASVSFEDSTLYDYFANRQFLFIILQEPSAKASLYENRFKGFIRYTFSDEQIRSYVQPVWDEVRRLILTNTLKDVPKTDGQGRLMRNGKGNVISAPNFPKSRDYDIFLRGSGTDSDDKPVTVNGISMYRQHVWMKGKWITDLIADRIDSLKTEQKKEEA